MNEKESHGFGKMRGMNVEEKKKAETKILVLLTGRTQPSLGNCILKRHSRRFNVYVYKLNVPLSSASKIYLIYKCWKNFYFVIKPE